MRIEYHHYLDGADAVVEILDADGEQVDCLLSMDDAVSLCRTLDPANVSPAVTVRTWASYAHHNEHC